MDASRNATWRTLARAWLLVFVVLYAASMPFPYGAFPNVPGATAPFWHSLIALTGSVLSATPLTVSRIDSDSFGMLVHCLNISLIAMAAVLFMRRFILKNSALTGSLLFTALRYFLAAQLLLYGLDKLFLRQFYTPEANILFTALGELTPDILIWSAIGLSKPYCIITGALECFAAVLLCSRRTVLPALLLAFACLAHVFIINVCFDISVKMHAGILLLLCFCAIGFYLPALMRFFSGAFACISHPRPLLRGRYAAWIKVVLVAWLLAGSIFPYMPAHGEPYKTPLAGAYEVDVYVENGDTLKPCVGGAWRWRRFFVHSRGWAVVQDMDDIMQDCSITVDTDAQMLTLGEPTFPIPLRMRYRLTANGLVLDSENYPDTLHVECTVLETARMPAFR